MCVCVCVDLKLEMYDVWCLGVVCCVMVWAHGRVWGGGGGGGGRCVCVVWGVVACLSSLCLGVCLKLNPTMLSSPNSFMMVLTMVD